MPKAKKRKRDSSIVRTQPDNRRATGNDEDDDFDIEETKATGPVRRSSGVSRYQRTRPSTAKTEAEEDPFPFMRLPAEIRNMIYRYLVVSKSPHRIRLDLDRLPVYFDRGGIEIAILLTNHQIHTEAAKILYDENKFAAVYSAWNTGVSFRRDDPKTKSATSRSLRSGRTVDMAMHKGLIYYESLPRLRHVEFRVEMFDRTHMCDHMIAFYGERVLWAVSSLFDLIDQRGEKKFRNGSSLGRGWSVRVNSGDSKLGKLPLSVLLLVLLPLRQREVMHAVAKNKLKFELTGIFPKNWESLFHGMSGFTGFVTTEVKQAETDPIEVDLEYLEEYFALVRDAWEDPDNEHFFDY